MNEYKRTGPFYRKKFVHKCQLQSREVLKHKKVSCKKIFGAFCSISPKQNYRNIYFKSSKALRNEREMHVQNYFHIIHPFSLFVRYWEFFMITIYIYQLTVLQYVAMIMDKEPELWFHIHHILFFKLIGMLNMCLQCFTGYYVPDTRSIVLKQHDIIWKYLKSYFLPDLLANCPLSVFFYYLGYDVILVKFLVLTAILNIFSLLNLLNKFQQKHTFSYSIFQVCISFLICLIGIAWFTALIHHSRNVDRPNRPQNTPLLWWTYETYSTMFALKVAGFKFAGAQLISEMCAIIFGFVMEKVIRVQIILIGTCYYSRLNKYQLLSLELNEFCSYKKLPLHLRAKLHNYYAFKYQNRYYSEEEIWNKASETLRLDIQESICEYWFEADIFKLCPLEVRQHLMQHLEDKIYLVGDVIYEFGSQPDYIYFIKCGTVAFYDNVDDEVKHVEEDNFFSEEALVLAKIIIHTHKAVAAENCVIYSLSRENFQSVMSKFPQHYAVILDILRKRAFYLKSTRETILRPSLKLADYYFRNDEVDDDDDDKSIYDNVDDGLLKYNDNDSQYSDNELEWETNLEDTESIRRRKFDKTE